MDDFVDALYRLAQFVSFAVQADERLLGRFPVTVRVVLLTISCYVSIESALSRFTVSMWGVSFLDM